MPKAKKQILSIKQKDPFQKAVAISFLVGILLGIFLRSNVALSLVIGLGLGFFVGKFAVKR